MPTPFENRLPRQCLDVPDAPVDTSAILDKVKAARYEAMLMPLAALPDIGHAPHLALGPATVEIDHSGATHSAAGGNPYLIHLNRCRTRFKQSRPDRYKMTDADQQQVVEEARQEWNDMSPAELQCFQSMYDASVRRRRLGLIDDSAVPAAALYDPGIGIGTQASVINPVHFAQASQHSCA